MDFSFFAQVLAPAIRSEAVPIYTRTIFEAALPEKEIYRLKSFSLDCFKNYYYGRSKIDKLKKSVGSYMNFKLFEKFIQGHSLSVRQKLCDIFTGETSTSVSTQIAHIFNQIMSNDTRGYKVEWQDTNEIAKMLGVTNVTVRR